MAIGKTLNGEIIDVGSCRDRGLITEDEGRDATENLIDFMLAKVLKEISKILKQYEDGLISVSEAWVRVTMMIDLKR